MSFRDGSLYFAPNVLWSDVELENEALLREQLEKRFMGFYLEPAHRLLQEKHDFAAGVIILCAFDAIARLFTGLEGRRRGEVKDRFITTFRQFSSAVFTNRYAPDWADIVYENFRNGLVHESRIKRGARFDVDGPDFITVGHDVSTINPEGLLRITCEALRGVVNMESTSFQANAVALLRTDFANDLATG